MQTFLPYSDYDKSAATLDNKRLGKQRVEVKQIYLALSSTYYGWQSHPAVQMWRGCEKQLLLYGIAICKEWRRRGYNDSLLPFFETELTKITDDSKPKWLGNDKFHSSHRSNLLRKDKAFYSKYLWSEDDDLPYYWPTKTGIV